MLIYIFSTLQLALWFNASLCVLLSFPKRILGNKRTNFEFKILCRRMSTNYSSEGHPGINTAHTHRILLVLVYIFWKIHLWCNKSYSLLHEPCAINVLNKSLRKFVRSWNKIWTVERHLQATFWCQCLHIKKSPERRGDASEEVHRGMTEGLHTPTQQCHKLHHKNQKFLILDEDVKLAFWPSVTSEHPSI